MEVEQPYLMTAQITALMCQLPAASHEDIISQHIILGKKHVVSILILEQYSWMALINLISPSTSKSRL